MRTPKMGTPEGCKDIRPGLSPGYAIEKQSSPGKVDRAWPDLMHAFCRPCRGWISITSSYPGLCFACPGLISCPHPEDLPIARDLPSRRIPEDLPIARDLPSRRIPEDSPIARVLLSRLIPEDLPITRVLPSSRLP